jgi:hypothetical protein
MVALLSMKQMQEIQWHIVLRCRSKGFGAVNPSQIIRIIALTANHQHQYPKLLRQPQAMHKQQESMEVTMWAVNYVH